MSFLKRPGTAGVLYALLLAVFTLYVVLDTFVIPQPLPTPEQPESGTASTAGTMPTTGTTPTTGAAGTAVTGTGTVTKTPPETPLPSGSAVSGEPMTYTDSSLSIVLTTYRVKATSLESTTVYVADIRLTDVSLLKTAFANDTFGANIRARTSDTAKAHDAVLAINGDYYGARVKDGGYVLRNGTVYQDVALKTAADRTTGSIDDLIIRKDGSFAIINEAQTPMSALLADGAQQVLAFGPAMLENGALRVSGNEKGLARALNPRTAIGIYEPGHYVFVVAEGRQKPKNCGISVYRLAQFMQELGVQTAYNLDGGGSSALWFNGQLINHPTTDGKTFAERGVSDIVYIGYR